MPQNTTAPAPRVICYRGASIGIELLHAELRDADRCAVRGCKPCQREASRIRAALSTYVADVLLTNAHDA